MEKHITITSARQQLLELTKQVRKHMDKFVLTNKGQPEAVLLSIPEYKGLIAASALLSHPHVLDETQLGAEQLKENKGLSVEKAFEKTKANTLAATV